MKYIHLSIFLLYSILLITCSNIEEENNPLDKIMLELQQQFPDLSVASDKFEIQIRYTQVHKSDDSNLDFKTYTYRENPSQYFYPASTVKMPVAILALEKLESLQKDGYKVSIDTPIKFLKGPEPLTEFLIDSTALDNKISIRHLINQIFSVSDNNAYNRLFSFLGRDQINKRLYELGAFENSHIIHRVGVSGFDYESNGLAEAFTFYQEEEEIYSEELKNESKDWTPAKLKGTTKGKAYISADEETINQPFDMSQKNFITLEDLEKCLKRVIHPDSFTEDQQFDLNDDNRSFLLQAMARLPREHQYLKFDTTEYCDAYGKFFVFGDSKKRIPDHLRIFNKVGYAYGTLTDCAFIVDLEKQIAFYLSATILVNNNQIFNDGIYEYEELGIPFLAALGRKIYDHELKCMKKCNIEEYDLDFKREY